MCVPEIEIFLTHLAVKEKVTVSTQNHFGKINISKRESSRLYS